VIAALAERFDWPMYRASAAVAIFLCILDARRWICLDQRKHVPIDLNPLDVPVPKTSRRSISRAFCGPGIARHKPSLLDDERSSPVIGIGIYDAFTARLIQEHDEIGFLWLSSFCSSLAVGLPDCGLLSIREIEALVRTIRRISDCPLVADGGSSQGSCKHARQLVRACGDAGATAVCIEDYAGKKYSSLYQSVPREQVSAERQRLCLEAAVDQGRQNGCSVIARCESLIAGHGSDDLYRRCQDAADVGARAVFVQSTEATLNELFAFLRAWQCRLPVYIAPTLFPRVSHRRLFALGITHVIYANQLMRGIHRTILQVIELIRKDRGTGLLEPDISPVHTLCAMFPHN
jgi:phosphoenolpyruvate phosphomutase